MTGAAGASSSRRLFLFFSPPITYTSIHFHAVVYSFIRKLASAIELVLTLEHDTVCDSVEAGYAKLLLKSLANAAKLEFDARTHAFCYSEVALFSLAQFFYFVAFMNSQVNSMYN